jgi:hypothetical protein
MKIWKLKKTNDKKGTDQESVVVNFNCFKISPVLKQFSSIILNVKNYLIC